MKVTLPTTPKPHKWYLFFRWKQWMKAASQTESWINDPWWNVTVRRTLKWCEIWHFHGHEIHVMISVMTSCSGLVEYPEDGGSIFLRMLVPTYQTRALTKYGVTVGNCNTERNSQLILILEINGIRKVCIPSNKWRDKLGKFPPGLHHYTSWSTGCLHDRHVNYATFIALAFSLNCARSI